MASSSDSKYNHIPILEGLVGWSDWKRNMTLVLQEAKVWGHVEGDPNAWDEYPIENMPPRPDANSTPAEMQAYQAWWLTDATARSLIQRRMAPTIAQSISLPAQGATTKVTARQMWQALDLRFAKTDVLAKAEVRRKLTKIKLKDHHDYERFTHEFKDCVALLTGMGVTYDEYDTCLTLLDALPTGLKKESWNNFHQLLSQHMQTHIETEALAVIPSPVNTLFDKLVIRLELECRRLQTLYPANTGPGSEYVNSASTGRQQRPIRKHPNNPDGVKCTNCSKISHDAAHCWAPGGGMAGQGPKVKDDKSDSDKEVSAWAGEFDHGEEQYDVFAAVDMEGDYPDAPDANADFISDDDDFVGLTASNLPLRVRAWLDSACSRHLVKEAGYFWTYEETEAHDIQTANNGILRTKATGLCIARVTYNGKSCILRLHDCLHAPTASENLLSAGRFVRNGNSVALSDMKEIGRAHV